MKFLKTLLDLLPLNGSKVSLGVVLSLLGSLPYLIPGVNLIQIAQAILANPTKSGALLVGVGALHKFLKAKFPKAVID